MNRISPLSESDLNCSLSSSIQSHNNLMADQNCDGNNIPENSQNIEHDLSLPSPDVVISIKDESNCDLHNKNEPTNQVSAFVKFIKTSLLSNKKKSESILVNPKLICFQKLPNNQPTNQVDNSNSEQSNCNVNLSITSSSDIFCRFCQEYEPENELVTPCLCSGTLKYIHQSCLQRWIKVQDNRFCELCKYEFRMKITSKPLREWQKLEMSPMERRKIICSVTFHVIALICVIWSLYVLIERTSEEIHNGIMEWPLWTKLIVVAIGFIGGVVFMYVQCRMYVSLCRKWHIFNRTFIVQNISPTELLAAQKEAKMKSEDYQKNLQVNRTQIFGDVIPTNVNISFAPNVTSSNEDFEFSSPTENYIFNYDEKIFNDEGGEHFANENASSRDDTEISRPQFNCRTQNQ